LEKKRKQLKTRYKKVARNFLTFAHLATTLVALGVTVITT